MKTPGSSVRFTPSETTANQLEELSRITQRTPQAITDEIVTFELANMFSSTDDSAESLQRYLYRHDYSREQATKIAAAYNGFVLKQAEHTGRPATHAAVVEPSGRLWFPLLASRVETSARLARKALQAAAA